jgi:hypothetical protein
MKGTRDAVLLVLLLLAALSVRIPAGLGIAPPVGDAQAASPAEPRPPEPVRAPPARDADTSCPITSEPLAPPSPALCAETADGPRPSRAAGLTDPAPRT